MDFSFRGLWKKVQDDYSEADQKTHFELECEEEREAGVRKAEREAGKFERSIASLGARKDLAALVRGMRTFGGHSGVREKGCRSLLNSTPSATGDEFRAIWEEDDERRKVMVQQYKALAAVGVIDVVCHAISINASVAATVAFVVVVTSQER